MKQPDVREARSAHISIQPAERTRPSWTRVQLAAQIQRSAAPAGISPATQARPRELDSPQLADMEPEP